MCGILLKFVNRLFAPFCILARREKGAWRTMTETQPFFIRPINANDIQKVQLLARKSFRWIEGAFFSLSPFTFVAEKDGEILGGIVLNFYSMPDGQQGGFVSWIFTSPSARGLGVAGSLMDMAMEYFKSHGCQEIWASVEGYNASSMKLFANRGFTILSPGEQIRRYGIYLPLVWLRSFHLFDIGHYIWVNPGAAKPDNPLLQWLAVWLINSLFILLAIWRNNGFTTLNPLAFLAVPAIMLVLFGGRWAAMKLAARASGLDTRYRAWESGLSLTFVIALLFGSAFPTPGSLYPRSHDWNYRDSLSKLARMALAGMVFGLLFCWTLILLSRFAPLPQEWVVWFNLGLYVGIPLAIFDNVLAIVFPFVSFNGRRVWDFNRPLWGVLAVLTIALILI